MYVCTYICSINHSKMLLHTLMHIHAIEYLTETVQEIRMCVLHCHKWGGDTCRTLTSTPRVSLHTHQHYCTITEDGLHNSSDTHGRTQTGHSPAQHASHSRTDFPHLPHSNEAPWHTLNTYVRTYTRTYTTISQGMLRTT